MRILQLCKKYPFPIKDGEAIAINHLAKALYQLGATIDLLCMDTPKHKSSANSIEKEVEYYGLVQRVAVDPSIRAWDAFVNLFSSASYHIERFRSPDFESQLIELLKKRSYDVIQLETLYLAPYIPAIRRHSKAKISMRAHNVEHEIWDRIMLNAKFLPKKWYLNHLSKKLRKFEQDQLQHYDILAAISEKDLQTFRKMGFPNDGIVIPIGIDQKDYKADVNSFSNEMSISFIGSLDWKPNQEGLVWFLDQIWDQLLKAYPNLSLHIAGRNTPEWIMNLDKPNIKVYGEVPSATDFINQHSLMIVPLLSGSGMRAKILEGMALGKVVITTSLGLEGIDAKNREQVLVANNLKEFKESIDFCYSSNGQLSKLGQNARSYIKTHYDNLNVGKQLFQHYEKHLQKDFNSVSTIRTAER